MNDGCLDHSQSSATQRGKSAQCRVGTWQVRQFSPHYFVSVFPFSCIFSPASLYPAHRRKFSIQLSHPCLMRCLHPVMSATIMKLRDHPLLSRYGVKSWPPTWTWIEGQANKKPKGEIGCLKEVKVSKTGNRCFLVIVHERSTYIGTLFISNFPLFVQLSKLLRNHCGRSLGEIGNLDLSYTL